MRNGIQFGSETNVSRSRGISIDLCGGMYYSGSRSPGIAYGESHPTLGKPLRSENNPQVIMKHYPKCVIVKDGTCVWLRPAAEADQCALQTFLSCVTEDQQCIPAHVSSPGITHQAHVEATEPRDLFPILAVREDDGKILAHCALQQSRTERRVAYLRFMTLPDTVEDVSDWMILDCVKLAMDLGMQKVFAEFVAGPHDCSIEAARNLDFEDHDVLKNCVRDSNGACRDLVVMVRDLHSVRGEL